MRASSGLLSNPKSYNDNDNFWVKLLKEILLSDLPNYERQWATFSDTYICIAEFLTSHLLQSLGNGEVDFDEFLLMMKKQIQARDVDSEMREAFRVFDRNGDGQIRLDIW